MRDLEKNPLRLGILGCGHFVQRRILPALSEVKTIRAVCIQKRQLTEAGLVATAFHIPRAVTTREQLLADPQVEAVLIATPNEQHEVDAIACAQAHKPTLCEKPLAPTVAAIERMIQAFQQNQVPLLVGHSLRFKHSIRIAKQLYREGALGSLLKLKAHYSIPVAQSNWRHQKAYGGGVLQDIGVHLIDLIHFLTEEKFESVYAIGNLLEVDQTVSTLCRLSNGAIASFECSFEEPYSSGFEIIGTKSRLISSYSLRQTFDPVETLCHIREDDSRLYIPLKAMNIYVEELKHFAEVTCHSISPLIPAHIGWQNQLVVEAALFSLFEKKKISLAKKL